MALFHGPGHADFTAIDHSNLEVKMALINRAAAAAVLSISPRTLEKWAVTGEGPPFYKLGGRVVYDRDDLRAWLDTCRRNSTSTLAEGGSHA